MSMSTRLLKDGWNVHPLLHSVNVFNYRTGQPGNSNCLVVEKTDFDLMLHWSGATKPSSFALTCTVLHKSGISKNLLSDYSGKQVLC